MIIEKTKNTPRISFDNKKYEVTFEGASYPENSKRFYSPIKEILENFLKEIKKNDTKVICKLSILSSTSVSYMFEMLKMFNNFSKKNNSVSVDWYYEEDDEEMCIYGDCYKKEFNNLSFKIIKIKDLELL
jgi:hypothetical protein